MGGILATAKPIRVSPALTLLIGAVGGAVVGMTSVGSGSLIIVSLMLLYPALKGSDLVGTDLVQAILLVGAAALAHVFILHDKGDPLVPYVESEKAYTQLAQHVDTTFLVSNLFDHVQPRKDVSLDTAGELARLYAFVDEALDYL